MNMKVAPKVRGFICTTAHPQGCAQQVKRQIDYVQKNGPFKGPKNVLVIGGSTGFGLASAIVPAFGADARVLTIAYEKPPVDGKRTASAGWSNLAALEQQARAAGKTVMTINGDAFSDEIKKKTIQRLHADFGPLDLVIYSLASPRRVDPVTGDVYQSSLKTLSTIYRNKTVDPIKGTMSEAVIEPANQDEIDQTVAVMGGEDWALWIDALQTADLLAPQAMTIAYSYIGPELTYPLYRKGTIGCAKEHLEQTAKTLQQRLKPIQGQAYVSVNKALVTQSSAAIPVVPLYIALLFKVMKQKGVHEDCIEQIDRLYRHRLYQEHIPLDDEGRIRIDDWEMRADVQQEVAELWQRVNAENIESISDLAGYRQAFYRLFGFEDDAVDYEQPVDVDVQIPSLTQ